MCGVKVVFLDIDGVVNRFKFNYNGELDNTFDEKCIKNLARIVNETGCSIVISSSWKASNALMDVLEENLIPNLPKGSVIGCTPTIVPQVNREIEIKKYLESHDVTNYVVIDDYDFELRDIMKDGHCVITDALSGLTEQDAETAIKILKTN